MSEQVVKILQIAEPDAGTVGEQARTLVSFVDADGAPLAGGVPAAPAEAGTYTLQAEVDGDGVASFTWVAAE